jgi:hypothetical protein
MSTSHDILLGDCLEKVGFGSALRRIGPSDRPAPGFHDLQPAQSPSPLMFTLTRTAWPWIIRRP